MGTDVHNKAYFLGSYPTRDVRDTAGTNVWASYNEHDKIVRNDRYLFLRKQVIFGYSAYEKEQLKQTILTHELIFKHQLEELHLLYKRQKDLMSEIKRREMCKIVDLNEPVRTEEAFISASNSSFCDLTLLSYMSGRICVNVHENQGHYGSGPFSEIEDGPEPIKVERFSSSKHREGKKGKRTIFGAEIVEVKDVKIGVGDVLPNTSKKIFGFSISVTSNPIDDRFHFEDRGTKAWDSSISGLKRQIDLNLSLIEGETPPIPSLPEAVVKITTTEIDLEAPAVLELETGPSPYS